jgi:hypothetical protein
MGNTFRREPGEDRARVASETGEDLMLVDVVKMRAAGKKLPPQEVKAAPAIRARLLIKTRPWREAWAPNVPMELTTFASLFDHLDDDPIAQPLMQLRQAHVNSLDGNGFVIVGLERSGPENHERDDAQAWWCRLVDVMN